MNYLSLNVLRFGPKFGNFLDLTPTVNQRRLLRFLFLTKLGHVTSIVLIFYEWQIVDFYSRFIHKMIVFGCHMGVIVTTTVDVTVMIQNNRL